MSVTHFTRTSKDGSRLIDSRILANVLKYFHCGFEVCLCNPLHQKMIYYVYITKTFFLFENFALNSQLEKMVFAVTSNNPSTSEPLDILESYTCTITTVTFINTRAETLMNPFQSMCPTHATRHRVSTSPRLAGKV